jgi:hypothetical protein
MACGDAAARFCVDCIGAVLDGVKGVREFCEKERAAGPTQAIS